MVLTVTVAGVFHESWWGWFGGSTAPNDVSEFQPPPLTTDRPEDSDLTGGPYADVPERGDNSIEPVSRTASIDPTKSAALLESAHRALASGDKVLARAHFSEAMNLGLSADDEQEARRQLRVLGRDTVFSPSCFENDPFASYYTVQPGDSLGKIATAHDVTADLLARINNISDVNRIGAGQRLKVIRGPFHARVTKSTHTIDVFLGTVFVDHFKVGLGADDATPTGAWVVRNKLTNPTYYPPRSGDIVSADDPANPLGERWIGLEGVDGNAVGQMRYGIHGTVEPDSIGRNASLGCVRLYNEDVEFLYDLLIVNKSKVEIRD
ncbi:MAG: L,D-transpeptidase family protein [Phycisphaerales bacterium]|nr:L,D-transpeptidase family protein [Phycisphaerales bacterium]